MQKSVRAVFVCVGLAALLAACSKPMSPSVERDGSANDGTAQPLSWSAPDLPDPQVARARLRFVADEVELDERFRTRVRHNVEYLVDVVSPAADPFAVLATLPAFAKLVQVRWRAAGDKGPEFVVDSSPEFTIDSATFPPPTAADGGVPPGLHLLRIRAPEKAGGGEVEAWLQSNFPPDTWWAGPDPALFPPSSDGDGRAVDVLDWSHFTTQPAWPPDGRGWFGPDSFASLPRERLPVHNDIETRTFYEIWGDRIYARSEGDVVHEGAWLVFMPAGFDRDSPYVPNVESGAPTLPPGFETQPKLYPLLHPQGLDGSPIGFRHQIPIKTAQGTLIPSYTTTYPDFRPSSVFYQPQVAGYARAMPAGKAYAVAAAVDGHGYVGPSTAVNWVALADKVDAGLGTPEEVALRRRVITFQIQAASEAQASASAVLNKSGQPGRRW